MKKQLSSTMMVAVIASLILAACAAPAPAPVAEPTAAVAAPAATSAPAAASGVTIKFLEWWDAEWPKGTLDELDRRFEAKSGIHVERTGVGWGAMYDNLLTNAQAGTATYDVLGMEACCFLTGIDKLGGIEPLQPYMDRDPAFVKGLTDLTVVNWLGAPMMLNWYIMPYSYVYDVDTFAKAGLKPPTSWAEMLDVSRQLNKKIGPDKYGLGVGLSSDGGLIQVVYYMFGGRLAQLGGRFYDEDNHVVFNSPEGVAALQSWKDLYDSGLLSPGAMGMSFAQARELLAAGTIAATFEGPFAQTIAAQVKPDIHLAYPPAWHDKAGGYQWGGSGLAISSNSKHKEQAWEYIKFVLSDEISLWLTETATIPFATKAVFSSFKTSTDPILSQIPAMLNQDSEHNLMLNPTPEFVLLHTTFVEAFQAVMVGDKQPKEALDEVAAVWNAEIDKLR